MADPADVTVLIPTLPERADMLHRAITSIRAQSSLPGGLLVGMAEPGEGSAEVRNRLLDEVTTPWVAFLDDDDEFLPHHLAALCACQAETGADVVYPGCRLIRDGVQVPTPHEAGAFGLPFDAEALRDHSYIPVTSLVRADLARKARFVRPEGSVYDDWGFYLRLLDLGATFAHLPVVSWVWNIHGGNTSGLPSRRG